MQAFKKLLIWDFDGVILDSFELDFETTKKFVGIKKPEEHYEMFSGNIHQWNADHDWPEHIDGKTFDQHLDEKIFDNPIFPEIGAVIKEIFSKGITQVIVSSAPDARIDTLLKKHGLRHAFSAICGSDVEKSKVKKFQALSEKYSTPLPEALFVTDTLGDLREAAQVHLPSIAVSWGYHPHTHLEQGNPLVIVHTPDELKKEIEVRLINI